MSNITALHLMLARQDDPLTGLVRRALSLLDEHTVSVSYYLQSPEPLEPTIREAVSQQVRGDVENQDMSAVLHLLWQEKQGLLPGVVSDPAAQAATTILAQALNLPETTGLDALARAAAQLITSRHGGEQAPPVTQTATSESSSDSQTPEQSTDAPVSTPDAQNRIKSAETAPGSPKEHEPATGKGEGKKRKTAPNAQTNPSTQTAPESEITQSITEESEPLDPDAWKWLTQAQILEGRERLKENQRNLTTQQRTAVRHVASRAAALHHGSEDLEKANPNEQLGLTLIAQIIRPSRPEERGPSREEQFAAALREERQKFGSAPYSVSSLVAKGREVNERLKLGMSESEIKSATRHEISQASLQQLIHSNGTGYYTNII